MATTVCWKCGKDAHMTLIRESVRTEKVDRGFWRARGAYTCDNCRQHSIGQKIFRPVITFDDDDPTPSRDDLVSQLDGEVNSWHPNYPRRRVYPDVPEPIARAAREAQACLGFSLYRGASALARAVVEATAKDKAITRGTLESKIDEMERRDLLRPHIKDAAHEVRHLGNEMAHGDFIDPVDKEEAEAVLGLMDEILNEVYQSPAKVERQRAARLARKEKPAAHEPPLDPPS